MEIKQNPSSESLLDTGGRSTKLEQDVEYQKKEKN